ncbi:MAG: CRISPR-associated helicase Cas3' [bacterium]|nr:CRISPR-associated helicase Cas3' [bacterium]
MEAVLSFSNLYSHPDRPLEIHLINVTKLAIKNLEESPIKDLYIFSKDKIRNIVKVCGLCHDLGKATRYFQKYLFADEKVQKKLRAMKETHHSLLSAVIAFFATSKEFEDDKDLDNNQKLLSSFIAYLSTKRHHGDLEDILTESILDDEDEELLNKQIDSIDETRFLILAEILRNNGLNVNLNKAVLKECVVYTKEHLIKLRRRFRKIEEEKNVEIYLLINLIFSLLIDADKNEVGIKNILERRNIEIPHTVVDKYKASKGFKNVYINQLREEAYIEVNSKNLDLSQRIYSLNLPTGLGKTFASFAFALRLRDKIHKEKGYMPRIIYSLPFLSIIDQNAQEIENIFKTNEIALDTDIFLKHHHLSDTYYKKGCLEFEPEEAKLLIEGWNSEVIITTFVQLFHTLVSNRNKPLLRFHRLAGSIIILDEVQAIPFKYWLLLKELLCKIARKLDVYIIFVTATQPLIIPSEDMYQLVNPEKYFKQMERVAIKVKIGNKLSLEEFIRELDLEDNKSYLFVLNTITSAREFYRLLKDKTGEEIVYMSSHIVPYDRLKRIKKIKEKEVRLAVTTQLVEAGVDIDFDVVYRDMAPLDSIIQAVGRCNRNWEKKGETIVIYLKDENRSYASYIYDSLLLEITAKILSNREVIEEREFWDIINSYYLEVQKKKSSDISTEFINAIYRLKYNSIDETRGIEDFKLIEEDYPKFEVFIELNDEARNIWERFIDVKGIKDLVERRIEFNKFKADFYKYVISIPVNVENIPPIINGFGYVSNSSLSEYYDEVTGFKPKGDTVLLW